MQVNDYPTLLLYPADDKSNPVRHTEAMQKWCMPFSFCHMLLIALLPCLLEHKIKLSKKSSVKAMAKQIKEELQISDVETVAAADGPTAADNVKDEL